MDILMPTLNHVLYAYGIAAVLALAGVMSLPTNFRVNGPVNYLLFTLFAPVPVIVGVPLADLVALDPYAALPPVGMTVIVALPWVYLILPALLPDFQVDSFTSALVPSVLVGGGLFIGGMLTNSFPNGLLLGETDSNKVFLDRSAGTDLMGVDPAEKAK